MATKVDLIIDQGTDYKTFLNLTDDNGDPLNLTGFGVSAQMRKHYTSTNSVTFTASINVSSASIILSLSEPETANLNSGRFVYDVELTNTSDNTVSRVVEGIVTVTPQVTRV